jgi:hypothetical protein
MYERERERGISEWLVRKVEEIYARTRNKVKVGEKEGEWFETTKGVRQGCPLEVNVEKTKMMVFNKRKRKNEESEWRWEENKIERVSEFKYLGYIFNERATDKAQVREVVRKANKVIGCMWGIGERKWGGEFGRIMMFESMVESVLMYGAEIWGWKEQEEVERVQEKYLKWVLGVDRETPGKSARGAS